VREARNGSGPCCVLSGEALVAPRAGVVWCLMKGTVRQTARK
jgi:hypothetical protein